MPSQPPTLRIPDVRGQVRQPGKYHNVPIRLPVCGRVIQANLSVPDVPARLSDVVPTARWLASEISAIRCEYAELCGMSAQCAKGCSHCCGYLVPISVPEAFRLCEDIQSLPAAERDLVVDRFQQAARAVFSAPAPPTAVADDPEESLKAVSRWYTELGISCPLLRDHQCSRYMVRPIVCREYYVTSAPNTCRPDSDQTADVLPNPISVAECLMQLAAEVEGAELDGIIMTTVLAWLPSNMHRHQQTWPAPELYARLVDILQDRAQLAQAAFDAQIDVA